MPAIKTARAEAPGLRQETQYTCMATSMASALHAQGKDVTEADVNRVMGCGPMRGASWEDLLATAQYFGMRATLVVPATVEMLRDWTSRGIPVIIAWNPEGRPWSHASVVVDVDDQDRVHIMDPNIPNPAETFRVVELNDFYKKWVEAVGDKMLVRRPAVAIEREVTAEGRQVKAAWKGPMSWPSGDEMDGSKEIGRAQGRQIENQQRKELAEYVEHNFGMTPMKAVEQWLHDNNVMGKPVENAMRHQLQDIARHELRMAAKSVQDSQGKSWGPRRGLEGPFRFRSGIVLYYDPRENGGQYYDPSTDMYVDNRNFSSMTGENWQRKAANRVADMWLSAKGKGSQPTDPSGEEKTKDKNLIKGEPPKRRNPVVQKMIERSWGAGGHGPGQKQKNRQDRRDTKNKLRDHLAIEGE